MLPLQGEQVQSWSRKFACHAAKKEKKKKTQGREKEMEGQETLEDPTAMSEPRLVPTLVGAPEGPGVGRTELPSRFSVTHHGAHSMSSVYL